MLVPKQYHLKDVYITKTERNEICVKPEKTVEFMMKTIQHYAKSTKIIQKPIYTTISKIL